MMPETDPDEVFVIEEQVRPVPTGPAIRRVPAPARVAGMVLGGLTVGLTATTIAIRLANRRRRNIGRRRAPLFNFQPRAAIFAPSVTITLPFSGIGGQTTPSRRRPMAVRTVRFPRRGRPARPRLRAQATREVAGTRRWLPRSARRPAMPQSR